MAIKSSIGKNCLQKDNLLFESLGDLDEAICVIGLAKVAAEKKHQIVLERVQSELMLISSIIAGYVHNDKKTDLFWLERQIRIMERFKIIPKSFILPGVSDFKARLHLARSMIRRAERKVITLSRKQKIDKTILDFLNRLSWLLFLIAV